MEVNQELSMQTTPETPDNPYPKKALWERKLLDLGLRNTLINLRLTKTQLPLITNSLDALENALSDGSDFTILPKPSNWVLEEFSFDTLRTLGDATAIQADFASKKLRSIFPEGELNKVIKGLYRAAKVALEENGANTLYLALGMLKWFEDDRSTEPRYAPIILLPIEIIRRSAAQGYVIRLRDNEPQMNITLLEKLKQDFEIVVEGLDPLPLDEHGIDIPLVLTLMRDAIMHKTNWEILETADIGIFSFSQFVMWNDIRNRTEDLMRNKVVRSLMEGKLAWEAEPLEIGERVSENNVLLPMPADASQLYAIQAACKGETFVLHGPPGTGKSQTITSLIANALAAGKRVLFVAEKMAALQVVQKRLENIGIGPFCLELHSNKSKKKDVLEQLRIVTEVTKNQTAESYAAKAAKLAEMRKDLDIYAQQLHETLPCGTDLYTLINEYEAFKDADTLAPFEKSFLQDLDAQALEQQQLLIEQLIAVAKAIGHPHQHPLEDVACTEYSQALRNDLATTIESYMAQIDAIAQHVALLADRLGKPQPESYNDVLRLAKTSIHMECWYNMPTAWTKAASPQVYFDDIAAMVQHAKKTTALETQLLERFEPDFLTQDGKALFDTLWTVMNKWFLPKAIGLNKLKKQLNFYAKTPLSKDEVRTCIVMLRDQQKEKTGANELLKKYAKGMGALYAGKSTDWDKIAQMAATANASAQGLYKLYGNYDILHAHCGAPELQEAVCGLRHNFGKFRDAKAKFDQLLNIRQKKEENWLPGQKKLCQSILDHNYQLKEWIAYVSTSEEARTMGLSNVVDAYNAGTDHDALFPAYKKVLLHGLISHTIDDSNTLHQFSGAVFNEKIAQYKRMDAELTRLSQQEVYCRLASKVPNFTKEAAHSSELGILQRCIKSGGRGTSIRKMFDQLPNLLPRLCPCMLMSPISAAQYLDPKQTPFDIVVFDEASQLPTCKAVGVLARGIDAVIVGDPNQMPPTAFFANNNINEDEQEFEDMESILDDCLALNMPQAHLLWHYRSRHESLIAFSNSQFYENKLFTFPSVNDRESKVRLAYVDGKFDRGKSRTNRVEAMAVIDEIRRRFNDPDLSKLSIGIVTLNIAQQHLIDDLLSEACAQDPELEKWAFGGEEPLFIKNLESVQGDERDVILFSLAYSPTEDGNMPMNFGPLNWNGGWRRLNVAVSRARHEMLIFSSLRPEQMDMKRTSAEGVFALRAFLEFAEGRTLALDAAATQQAPTDGIANSISKALEEMGFETDLSVGRSEYRIDIGVVDPKNPDQYLLGIMLDGSAYGAAKTTRDREVAQVGILNGLGWNILRIWSVDWWDNRDKELSRIIQALEDIQNGKAEPEPEVIAPAEPAFTDTPVPAPENTAPIYTATVLPPLYIDTELFTGPQYKPEILKRLNKVVNTEAPVSQATLVRRVVQSFGITRAGTRIQTHMNALLRSLGLTTTKQADTVFYWSKSQNPESYAGFRATGENENRRDILDVPVQEVANAIYVVLYEQISMAQDDLLREITNKLGYARLGTNVLSALELGLQYAQQHGGITTGTNGAFILTDAGYARAEAIMQNF